MASSFEWFGLFVAMAFFAVAIWWLFVPLWYRRVRGRFVYTRGANAVGEGTNVTLTCDPAHEICVQRATLVQSIPDTNNWESATDPYTFSGFSAAAVDVTADMSSLNGTRSGVYTIPKQKFGSSTGVQLIATYNCIPKGAKCERLTQ